MRADELELISPHRKAKLNKRRHASALGLADELDGEIAAEAYHAHPTSPAQIRELLDALYWALPTAKDGEEWTDGWIRYCYWQRRLAMETTDV